MSEEATKSNKNLYLNTLMKWVGKGKNVTNALKWVWVCVEGRRLIFNKFFFRLLTSSDVQDYSLYPLISEYMKDLRKRCHVCDEYTAV